MKIIVAKRSGKDSIAYINANRVTSFLATKNMNNNQIETRIYFADTKCEIAGDHTKKILDFMMTESDSGVLDLTAEEKKSFWCKVE